MHDPHFQRLVLARLDEISERMLHKFASLEYKLEQLLKGAAIMSQALADLTAAVTKSTTVEQSAITMIQGLAAQIAAASTDPQVAALAAQLNAGADALAAAITANTPAAPAPAPVSTPATP